MRGRQVLMESLVSHGVRYMFGNPGTTESPILDALLDYPQLPYIVALHEGVALGAASCRWGGGTENGPENRRAGRGADNGGSVNEPF